MKRILVLECGLGFGGALTSLESFLDGITTAPDWEFHVLTAYPQSLIRPGAAVKAVGVLPRGRLYGPNSRLEKMFQPIFRRRAGNIVFLLDMLTSGFVYAFRVAKYIRKHRVDLVHLNNGTLINDAGIVGAKLAGVPALVHVRGPEFIGRTSAFFAKWVDHFLPVSEFIAQTVVALGVDRGRMTVVYEGLDVSEFVGKAKASQIIKELNLDPGIPKIIMAGCMVPWKGHAPFIEACGQVLDNHDAVILIVGDVPDNNPSFRHKLERQVLDLGLEDRIRFLGHRTDVASVMDAGDIVVHASTAPEPFGRVIIEAMALQKPVIATDRGGPKEIISNGKEGFLIMPGDPAEMASAIEWLIDNPSLRNEMGRAGKQRVDSMFSVRRHVQNVSNCYCKLLSS